MANDTAGAVWQTMIELPSAAAVPAFEASLEPLIDALGATLSSFEIGNGPRWRLTIHSTRPPDPAALRARLSAAAQAAGVPAPAPSIAQLDPTDWVAEYRRRTRAVRVGRFYVYPSHDADALPDDALPIRLDAGLAFGTGGHESTRGCLIAFGLLADRGVTPARALDLGCGSGILAIAIALLWPAARVLACDNDPMAVAVARGNVAANGVAERVRFDVGEGYAAPALAGEAPFDLIAANILAEPLRDMAGDLARRLAPVGHAVLSGLLCAQADEVLDAHRAHGLALVRRIDLGEWTTLIVGKGAPVSPSS